MRKILCNVLLSLIMALLCFSFAACAADKAESTDYVGKDGRCVVTIPQDYDIVYENDDIDKSLLFDKDLFNAKTVHGEPKKYGYSYLSVPLNEPFRILTPLGIISNRNENHQTLMYWKLNDTLYKDSDSYYSENVFTCSRDTEITPIYYEFREVGMILFAVDENDGPAVSEAELFDDKGNIIEQDGVYYLYGVYDFEPQREFWRTNLTLRSFDVALTVKAVAENFYKDFYTITVTISADKIFEKGKVILSSLCKIDGHGYMLYGASQVINDGAAEIIHTLPIGDHSIKYSFAA